MSDLKVVFATDTVLAHHPRTGVPVTIVAGGHWAADDPIVEAYPNFFADDPRYGLYSSVPLGDDGYPVGWAPPEDPAGDEATTEAAADKTASTETADANPATKPAATETADAAPATKRRRGGRASL